ncbi:MAG: xylulokinase [Candidatus Brockarchaeota archaeon]|nr:xylulokinase [Candidatus Brockarchaeota archaeon]
MVMQGEPPLMLGLDLGTSSVKATLVDSRGSALLSTSRPYPIESPVPGWCEQDPAVWWRSVKEVIHELLSKTGFSGDSVSSLCVSGQMHGMILLNSYGQVLRPAIIWSDNRSRSQCVQIENELGVEALIEITGNRAATGFAAVSFLWVRQNEPRIAEAVKTLLFPKDYIRMMLTGVVCTDFSDASGSLLLDIRRRQWSQEIASILGIGLDALPEIKCSHEAAGELTRRAAEALGLRPGTVVATGGGDSMVGALGCGVTREGVWSVNIGTGGQVLSPTARPVVDMMGRTNTFCHAAPDMWVVQGSTLSAGLSLRWFRDALGREEKRLSEACGIDVYDILTLEAAKAPPCSKGLVFLPYLIGERTPHNDPAARGVFFGLSLAHDKTHMVRAVLEGVAFALRDCKEVLTGLGLKPEKLVFRGGGSGSRLWREILANILSETVVSAAQLNDVSFGSCLLAGTAYGLWRDLNQACAETVKYGDSSNPDPSASKIYDKQYQLYVSLYHHLKPLFQLLAEQEQAANGPSPRRL